MTLVATVLLSFVIIALVIAAMGVGVMAGRQPIKGSCGGLNGGGCEICSSRCRRSVSQSVSESVRDRGGAP